MRWADLGDAKQGMSSSTNPSTATTQWQRAPPLAAPLAHLARPRRRPRANTTSSSPSTPTPAIGSRRSPCATATSSTIRSPPCKSIAHRRLAVRTLLRRHRQRQRRAHRHQESRKRRWTALPLLRVGGQCRQSHPPRPRRSNVSNSDQPDGNSRRLAAPRHQQPGDGTSHTVPDPDGADRLSSDPREGVAPLHFFSGRPC